VKHTITLRHHQSLMFVDVFRTSAALHVNAD
jgi:hypothetical protein